MGKKKPPKPRPVSRPDNFPKRFFFSSSKSLFLPFDNDDRRTMLKPTRFISILLVAASVATATSGSESFLDEIKRGFDDEIGMIWSRQTTKNLQTFSGALGGIKADAVG